MEKRITYATLVVLMMSFLHACTSVQFAAVNLPTAFFDGTVETDITYGPDKRHTLDLYTPKTAKTDPAPLIIFFHGGRWTQGDKAQYRFVATALASHGYKVAVPNYRTYPNVKFPAFVEDAALATAWLLHNAAQYNIDEYHVFAMGHSSGAHMAALMLADEQYLTKTGLSPLSVRAFVGLSGPYSFTPDEPDLIDMFGPPGRYDLMNVATYINGDEPPMLLIHGMQDKAVGLHNIDNLRDAIEAHDAPISISLYPDLTHTDTIKAFSWIAGHKDPVVREVLGYLDSNTAQ